MVLVTEDKSQLHSFSHATDDYDARSYALHALCSNCMILVLTQTAPISVQMTAFFVKWFQLGGFLLGAWLWCKGKWLLSFVGSIGWIDNMAWRRSPSAYG